MLKSTANTLSLAEKKMYQGKFQEALDLIENLEGKVKNNLSLYLSWYVLKGRLYCYQEKYKKAIDIGNIAFEISQQIESDFQSIDALLIKAHCVFLGYITQSLECISKIEAIIKTIDNVSKLEKSRQLNDFLIIKSTTFRYADNLDEAITYTTQWLEKNQLNGEKLDMSRIYLQLCEISLYKGKPKRALDYAKESMKLQKELNNQIGIASSLYLIGTCYYILGDLYNALLHCKESLANSDISILYRIEVLHVIGSIYREKGEIERALRYYNRSIELTREEGYIEKQASLLMGIGTIYRIKGKDDKAIKYLTQSLEICEKIESTYGIGVNLFYLIAINLDNNKIEIADAYLNKMQSLAEKTKSKVWKNGYLITKALRLKKENRIRSLTKSELILTRIIEGVALPPQLYLISITNLCDLLLKELIYTNNDEIIVEIDHLIIRMLKMAKNRRSYLWFAETKLLQAKISLIQMDIKKAEKYMTEAQKIADFHGLNLLAIKISHDHDLLLDQSSLWNELIEKNAPISDRVKLSSINNDLNRLQGKATPRIPSVTAEEPILLLIMNKDGLPHFNYSFKQEWDYEFLFSAFMSAFNAFSSEIFSKTIDRIKIGEYRILSIPIDAFLICYVIKGPSYIAKRKLSQFAKKIISIPEIMDTLLSSIKTGKMLELDDPPSLGNLIGSIFTN